MRRIFTAFVVTPSQQNKPSWVWTNGSSKWRCPPSKHFNGPWKQQGGGESLHCILSPLFMPIFAVTHISVLNPQGRVKRMDFKRCRFVPCDNTSLEIRPIRIPSTFVVRNPMKDQPTATLACSVHARKVPHHSTVCWNYPLTAWMRIVQDWRQPCEETGECLLYVKDSINYCVFQIIPENLVEKPVN